MERLLLLPMLALLAASAAAAPSLERLTELAATAPYGDPEGDAVRAALADNTLAYSAKRWEGGVPPAVTEAGPHATVEHAAPGEAPTVPARGVEGPDAGATDSELEALTESDVGAPDGYDYGDILGLSLLFYEAQRSGKLPDTNRVRWRNDSNLGDKAPNGADAAGGMHDAGDHLKINFPGAWAAGQLAWAAIEFKKGFALAGQTQHVRDVLKHVANYYVKCHFSDFGYIAMIGSEGSDHGYWGRPEDVHVPRPPINSDANRPGSDIAGVTSAMLAATAMLFEDTDPEYALVLEAHARELWLTATRREGRYADNVPGVGNMYPATTYLDQLAWASAWLYRRTGESKYLAAAKKYYDRMKREEAGGVWRYEHSWSSNSWAASMLLATLTGDQVYSDDLHAFAEQWIQGGSPIWYTGTGLAFRHQWGSLRNVLGPAFIIAQYGHAIRDTDPKKSGRYTCWARGQLRYALGDAGRSFVVGYGNNPPQRVHHRAASCPTVTGPWGTNTPTCDFNQFNSGAPNPQILYGALAGGPDGGDNYADRRDDYVRNEVAVDYNAGFTGVLAFLTQSEDTLAACRARGDVVREVKAKGW